MIAGDMNVNKNRKTKRERKPYSRDEKTVFGCSFFASMLFLFFNFQQQQTLLDIILLLVFTMALLFVPLRVMIKYNH